ncbi:hypothetical protein TRIP_E230106 [uncultured Spirochaetota bacterium]|jgi:hypothetical protein|nr:hypothetical protein TRIP_E230106 [uncultured Spirochaetota bacterium]
MGDIVQFREGFLKKALRIREEKKEEEKREVRIQIQTIESDVKDRRPGA